MVEADLLRSLDGTPLDHIWDCHSALLSLGPQHAQSKSDCADSSPSLEKVTLSELLQASGARAMVADDGLDIATPQGIPELVLVALLSDGRAALVPGITILDTLGIKGEIVEAGLCRQLDVLLPGLPHQWETLNSRKVDNVEWELGGDWRKGYDLLDGICLKRWWTRVKECLVGVEGTRWCKRRLRLLDDIADGHLLWISTSPDFHAAANLR